MYTRWTGHTLHVYCSPLPLKVMMHWLAFAFVQLHAGIGQLRFLQSLTWTCSVGRSRFCVDWIIPMWYVRFCAFGGVFALSLEFSLTCESQQTAWKSHQVRHNSMIIPWKFAPMVCKICHAVLLVICTVFGVELVWIIGTPVHVWRSICLYRSLKEAVQWFL